MIIFENKPSADSKLFDNDCKEICISSASVLIPTFVPSNSNSSASSTAVSPPAPSSMHIEVRLASPLNPDGSNLLPEKINKLILAIGSSFFWIK